MKKLFTVLFATALLSTAANAQTNFQTYYDFGRGYATTTIEGFYADKWGDTFFFFDHYYATADGREAGFSSAMNGSYFEIERAFNFWKESSLKDLSIHTEYDGSSWGAGIFCIGAKYFLHSEDFKNTYSLYLMYDKHVGIGEADVPIKFSGVWGMQDIFGVEGLRFSGFIDIWGNNSLYADLSTTKLSVLTEPQVWYNVGKFINCPNLNLGTEIEISYNFAGNKGFMCNPCLGAKWVF